MYDLDFTSKGFKVLYGAWCLLILSYFIYLCRTLREYQEGTNRVASVGSSSAPPERERTIIVLHERPPEVPQEAYQRQPAFNELEAPPPSYSEATLN